MSSQSEARLDVEDGPANDRPLGNTLHQDFRVAQQNGESQNCIRVNITIDGAEEHEIEPSDEVTVDVYDDAIVLAGSASPDELDFGDCHFQATRCAQRNGNSPNSIMVNITEFGRDFFGVSKGDLVSVEVCENGIVLRPF